VNKKKKQRKNLKLLESNIQKNQSKKNIILVMNLQRKEILSMKRMTLIYFLRSKQLKDRNEDDHLIIGK